MLQTETCIHYEKGTPPLSQEVVQQLLNQLGNGWQVTEGNRLSRTYSFANFVEALAFTNQVGEEAEKQDHHPDIHLSWGKVTITTWTHTVNGLSRNDFILAAHCDDFYSQGEAS